MESQEQGNKDRKPCLPGCCQRQISPSFSAHLPLPRKWCCLENTWLSHIDGQSRGKSLTPMDSQSHEQIHVGLEEDEINMHVICSQQRHLQRNRTRKSTCRGEANDILLHMDAIITNGSPPQDPGTRLNIWTSKARAQPWLPSTKIDRGAFRKFQWPALPLAY